MTYKPELVTDAVSIVAESPVWNERDRKLYYVDIQGKAFRSISWNDGKISDIILPWQPGCFAFDEENRPVFGAEDGIYRLEDDASFTKISKDYTMKGLRFNDGKAGPDGSFYLGTISREGKGAFYRMDSCGAVTELFDSVGNANGLDWNTEKGLFYFNDTPKRKTDVFTFENGELSNRKTVISYEGAGNPDGMTMDTDGMLWVALWGGYKVVRVNPDNGKILEHIDLPVANVASCIFGGDDFSELIITTASHFTDLREQPLAGSVFKVQTNTCGRPVWRLNTK